MAERDFLGGITNTQLITESDGTLHILDTQDVEPILDYAEACRNQRFDASAMDGEMQHVAEIPYTIAMEWAKEAGCTLFSQEFSFVMEKKLKDPQYAKFLAAPKLRDPHVIMKGLR